MRLDKNLILLLNKNKSKKGGKNGGRRYSQDSGFGWKD